MDVSKIIGGLLLIGTGCESALAQGPAAGRSLPVARAPAPSAGEPVLRGGIVMDQPIARFHDTDRHQDRRHPIRGYRPFRGIGFVGYGGGYVYSEPARDMFGYFGAGGDVRLIDGQAIYDYDRSYPYDRFDEPHATGGRGSNYVPAPSYRCETKQVSSGSGNEPVQVRVCRR